MLDEEFDSLEKISLAAGGDVQDFDGFSQPTNISERSADCGNSVWEDQTKVTPTAVALEALEDIRRNAFIARPNSADATGDATTSVQGDEENEGSTDGQDAPVFTNASRRGSLAMTEDHDRFTNVEESFDQDYLDEKELEATGSISEYKSFTGRDTDNDDSSSFGGSPPKFFQALSKSNSNCDQFFCSSDDELAYGSSDWNEYLHQHESGLDSFVELQESRDFLTERKIGLPLDKSRGVLEETCIHVTECEDTSQSDKLADETPRDSEAGRLHTDDDDDHKDAEGESSVSAFLSIRTTLPAPHSDLEGGISLFQQDEDRVDYKKFWDLTSGSDVNSMREDTNNSMVGLQGQFEMQSTEELKVLAVQDGLTVATTVLPRKVTDAVNLSVPPEASSLDEISEAEFTTDSLVRTKQDMSVVGIACSPGLGNGLDSKHNEELFERELFGQLSAECHVQEDVGPRVSVGDCSSNKVQTVDRAKFEKHVEIKSLRLGKVQCPAESVPDDSTEDESKRGGVGWAAEDLGPDELSRYVEALEVKETYIDTVLDMEDVLFDGEGGGGTRSFQSGKVMSPGYVRPVRDGSLSASTSSLWASASGQINHPTRLLTDIEWVEIVGAVQRQGGASLGERVVGVKQHTVYRIKVKGGGKEWEIERRYRDFVVLYRQLQSLFALDKNVSLPPPWEKVKQESRKYFGNTSPDVVEFRSALIQACLQSLIRAGPPLNTATPLQRFLFPVGEVSQVSAAGEVPSGKNIVEDFSVPTLPMQEFGLDSPKSGISVSVTEHDDDGAQSSVLGKTIRLIVQMQKKQSLRQQLQAQHYSCAGCYKHLELAMGIVPEFVQNLGWSGPRLCEYSGQLFCSTCHLNETAVLPAWVLQRWDFTPRLVSQLAKAYLDSIYDKPMLCVSAVNPYLYARVPVLAHLTEMRRKINKMLACIRCPARGRIQAMLGSRRYLLENSDFCALRDLVDLSKGAFAVLPGYMRAILMKLSSHITRECFLCRELGKTCGAGELCDDPYDVIYPHQDELIKRCPSCQHPFHKRCYRKCQKCPSCRGQPELTMKDSALSIEQSGEHETGDLGSRLISTEPLRSIDPLTSSPVIASETKSLARRNLLATFLGSKESRGAEQEKDILEMDPLSSSIDL